MKKALFMSCVLSGIILLSCNKKDTALLTKKDYLTSGHWKQITLELKKNNGPWEIQNAGWLPCETDDEWIFSSNGVMQITEGATKCFPSDPQIKSNGTWSMNVDETKITTTSGSNVYELVIEKLTATEFLSTTSTIIGSDTYYAKRYMKH